jgi:hypothetical protein
MMLGSDLGARASQINANAAQMRLNPQASAAGVQARADAFNPWATALTAAGGNNEFASGLSSLFGRSTPQADLSVVGYNGPGRGNWF